jgi:hypothetical protein
LDGERPHPDESRIQGEPCQRGLKTCLFARDALGFLRVLWASSA